MYPAPMADTLTAEMGRALSMLDTVPPAEQLTSRAPGRTATPETEPVCGVAAQPESSTAHPRP